MTPAPPGRRGPWRAVLAVLVGTALGGLLLAAAGAPATAAGSGRGARAGHEAPVEFAFVGRVTAAVPYESDERRPGRAQGLRYTVNVVSLFGDAPITIAPFGEDTTVDVLAPQVFEGYPKDRATQRYLFRVTQIGSSANFQARRDLAIVEYERSADDALESSYGAKVVLNALGPGPDTPEPQEISFLCPDTGEVLPDPSAPDVDCDGLPAPTATDRAAAPGAALVLVGLLGLFVIRRLGSGRSRSRR